MMRRLVDRKGADYVLEATAEPGDDIPRLADHIVSLVVGAGYLTADECANTLADPVIWRDDSGDSEELPSGACAEHTYAVARHHVGCLLLRHGFDQEFSRALDDHARDYLTDCYTHAMLECAFSTVTETRMHQEILAALERRASRFSSRLDALLHRPATTG